MKAISIANELSGNPYPGRGIIIGRSKDGKKAVTAYFIMGRSSNSRNRVFVEDGEGIRTQAFDPDKLEDPSLIIYAPVRVLGNKTIVTNGDQTDTIYEGMWVTVGFIAIGEHQVASFGSTVTIEITDCIYDTVRSKRNREHIFSKCLVPDDIFTLAAI